MFGEPDSALYWFRRAIAQRADFSSCRSVAQIALLRRDYAMALECFEKFGSTSDQFQKIMAMAERSMIPLHRGRFTEAREGLVALLSSKQAGSFSAEQIGLVYEAVIMISCEMGDNAAMMKYASEYSRQLHTNPSNALYGRDFVAWALLKGGQSERSLHLFNEIAKEKQEDLPRAQRTTEYLAGLLAYEQGEFEGSRTHLADVLQREFPNHMPQYFYAVALLKTGRTADATQEFQRMTWMSPISYPPIALFGSITYLYWPIGAVKAHYWLGIAYEQQDEKAKAIKEYERFLETWKDAEKEWPEMTDARARLAKLKAGNARRD